MRDPRIPLVLMLALAGAACAPAEDEDVYDETQATEELAPQDQADLQAAAEEQLNQIRDEWVRAAEAGDAAAVAALYADDAIFVSSTGRMEGPQAIQDGLDFQGLTGMEVESHAVEAGTDLVAEMGTFTQTLEGEEGEQTAEGYYTVVLRQHDDGRWLIVQHLSALMPEEGEAEAGMDTDDETM